MTVIEPKAYETLPRGFPVDAPTAMLKLYEMYWEIWPLPTDLENYLGDEIEVPSMSIVTVSYRFASRYVYFIRKLYVDAAADCAYQWTILDSITYGTPGTKVMLGNEHEFLKRQIGNEGSVLQIQITNTSANDYLLDIIVDSWARKTEDWGKER